MNETQNQSLLGNLGNVVIDVKIDTADIVKIGLMLLIVLVIFAFLVNLIRIAFNKKTA